jgi:hypothetical protein
MPSSSVSRFSLFYRSCPLQFGKEFARIRLLRGVIAISTTNCPGANRYLHMLELKARPRLPQQAALRQKPLGDLPHQRARLGHRLQVRNAECGTSRQSESPLTLDDLR